MNMATRIPWRIIVWYHITGVSNPCMTMLLPSAIGITIKPTATTSCMQTLTFFNFILKYCEMITSHCDIVREPPRPLNKKKTYHQRISKFQDFFHWFRHKWFHFIAGTYHFTYLTRNQMLETRAMFGFHSRWQTKLIISQRMSDIRLMWWPIVAICLFQLFFLSKDLLN